MYPPGSPAYTTQLADRPLDLKKAKALLARAGYAHGLTLTLNISSTFYAEEATFAPIFKQDLAKIGVDLRLNNLSGTNLYAKVDENDYDLTTDFYAWGNVDPAQLFSSAKFATGENSEQYVDHTYAGMVAAAQGELDPTKRLAMYRALNAYLMDHALVIPIATRPFVYVSRPDVKNLPVDPNGMLMATDLRRP
jgi:ABC-type transport system substrate-binding protein